MEQKEKAIGEIDMTYNITDIIFEVIKNWKLGLICIIICSILIDGVSVYKAKQSVVNEVNYDNEEETAPKPQSVEEMRSHLSDWEYEEATKALESYELLKASFDETQNYYNSSIKMHLDPFAVPSIIVHYYIDPGYEVRYPTIQKDNPINDIYRVMVDGMISQENLEEVASRINNSGDASYYRELIDWNINGNNVFLTFMAKSKEDCMIMADYYMDVIDKKIPQMKEVFGEFDLSVVTVEHRETVNYQLMQDQQAIVSSVNNARNAYLTVANNLNEKCKNYYYAVLNEDAEYLAYQKKQAEKDATKQEPTITIPTLGVKDYFNVPMILAGMFLGFCIAFIISSLQYIYGGKLRTENDLEVGYGLTNLGVLYDTTVWKKSGYQSKLERLFKHSTYLDEQQGFELAVSNISVMAEKNGYDTLYLTSSCADEKMELVIHELVQKLEKKFTGVSFGKCVLRDAIAMEQMAKATNVIIVEKRGVSRYLDIKQLLMKCELAKVSVIGAVLLE